MTIIVQRRKICTKCGKLKTLDRFSKHPRTKDGLGTWCIGCRVEQQRQYRKHGPKPKKYSSNVCSVNICMMKRYSNGFCIKHNAKWRKYGDPLFVAPPRPCSPLTYDQRMKLNDPERWADMKRAAYIKRRRLLASAKQEPYVRLEIFERDSWICQLCFKPINRRIKGRKSKAPSIDHIIPLALGGDDTPDNVQAAHFGCNSGKCHRVREEVMTMDTLHASASNGR